MSIQAKELRIGNKLFTNLKNIHTVCQIHFEHNNIVDEECWIIGDNNHEISLLDLHPIPLSTDILLKCGFIFNNNYYWKTWGKNGVVIIRFDSQYNSYKIELGKWRYRVLSFLHELQNGFYFLTSGEELTLNP